MSPRKNEKATYPGRPVEYYLNFRKQEDQLKYRGKNKIPMETFHEMYFDGDVDFKGDALEVMEYRHDWANFRFTISLYWFFLTGMIPEVVMHTRSQGPCLSLRCPLKWPSRCSCTETHPLHTACSHTLDFTDNMQMKNKFAITTIAVMTSIPGSLVHA